MFPNVWHRARFFGEMWPFPVGSLVFYHAKNLPKTRLLELIFFTLQVSMFTLTHSHLVILLLVFDIFSLICFCLFSLEMSYPMSDGCILRPFFWYRHALLSESHRVN